MRVDFSVFSDAIPPHDPDVLMNNVSPLQTRPVVLTIAGSDNSGGAGLQADLKTFTTLGVYGTTAVTCVVAEHPGRVKRIDPLPVDSVREQILLVSEAFPVAAIKTGMLYSTEIINAVANLLEGHLQAVPLVIDPVMVASTGAPLLLENARNTMSQRLFSKASLVTPNRDEAALLAGREIRNFEELREVGVLLSQKFGVPFLLKGGHLQQAEALDLLCSGDQVISFSEPMVQGVNPHGTGCTLSAAIAAGLGKGLSLEAAVRQGKAFITKAIQERLKIGSYEVLNTLPSQNFTNPESHRS